MRIRSFRPIVLALFGLNALILAAQPGRAAELLAGSTPLPGGADTSLESVLPRDGLQLYFEVRGEGLAQLAKLAAAPSPVGESGKSGRLSVKELSGFALAHLAVLARARIALVTYAGGGFAVVIETANPNEARRIADDLARALNQAQSRPRTGAAGRGDKQPDAAEGIPFDDQRKIGSAVLGRVAIAGAEGAVQKITASEALGKLADDPEFLKSKSRFAGDPFFGYLAANLAIPNPPPGEESARNYMQGWALAQQKMPRSLVFGGSIAGDTAEFHGLIDKPDGKSAVLSSFLSAVKSAQPTAAAFACKDTDVFVDVMIDWNKLYQAVAPMAGMILGAGVQDSSSSGASALEKKLGFSVKDDLLPTLGGELAVAVHLPPAQAQQAKAPQAGQGQKPPSTGFYVVLALKDRARFEALIGKLFQAGSSGPNSPATITTVQYRGVTIKSIKGFSYAIADGFFIGCGGAGNLRKLLDERSAGGTLASKLDYHAAIGAPGVSLVQVYLSGSASARFLQKGQTESGGNGTSGLGTSGLGFVMSEVPSGIALNLRIPATLATTALSAAMNSNGGVFGIGPSAQSAAESSRLVNGKPVPKMSSEDMLRRP